MAQAQFHAHAAECRDSVQRHDPTSCRDSSRTTMNVLALEAARQSCIPLLRRKPTDAHRHHQTCRPNDNTDKLFFVEIYYCVVTIGE